MTTPLLQNNPYLREQRQFPNDDLRSLSNQTDHAYIDIAQKVNARTIGLYPTSVTAITGEKWFFSGSNTFQQSLRQIYPFFGITAATQANPAVLTIPGNNFAPGQSITIYLVVGMTQLNGNTYTILAVSGSSVTINVDSTGFGAYVSGGVAIPPHGITNFATDVSYISPHTYGSYTDGTNWYGAIYASNTAIAGQISFYISPTNIVILAGTAAPTPTKGVVLLEWISQI